MEEGDFSNLHPGFNRKPNKRRPAVQYTIPEQVEPQHEGFVNQPPVGPQWKRGRGINHSTSHRGSYALANQYDQFGRITNASSRPTDHHEDPRDEAEVSYLRQVNQTANRRGGKSYQRSRLITAVPDEYARGPDFSLYAPQTSDSALDSSFPGYYDSNSTSSYEQVCHNEENHPMTFRHSNTRQGFEANPPTNQGVPVDRGAPHRQPGLSVRGFGLTNSRRAKRGSSRGAPLPRGGKASKGRKEYNLEMSAIDLAKAAIDVYRPRKIACLEGLLPDEEFPEIFQKFEKEVEVHLSTAKSLTSRISALVDYNTENAKNQIKMLCSSLIEDHKEVQARATADFKKLANLYEYYHKANVILSQRCLVRDKALLAARAELVKHGVSCSSLYAIHFTSREASLIGKSCECLLALEEDTHHLLTSVTSNNTAKRKGPENNDGNAQKRSLPGPPSSTTSLDPSSHSPASTLGSSDLGQEVPPHVQGEENRGPPQRRGGAQMRNGELPRGPVLPGAQGQLPAQDPLDSPVNLTSAPQGAPTTREPQGIQATETPHTYSGPQAQPTLSSSQLSQNTQAPTTPQPLPQTSQVLTSSQLTRPAPSSSKPSQMPSTSFDPEPQLAPQPSGLQITSSSLSTPSPSVSQVSLPPQPERAPPPQVHLKKKKKKKSSRSRSQDGARADTPLQDELGNEVELETSTINLRGPNDHRRYGSVNLKMTLTSSGRHVRAEEASGEIPEIFLDDEDVLEGAEANGNFSPEEVDAMLNE